MISERLFSARFSTFWRDLLPFSRGFVRGINYGWEDVVNDSPAIEPIRRSVLNETAMRVFCRSTADRAIPVEEIVAEVERWLRAPEQSLTPYERSEISWMVKNLDDRFPIVRRHGHQNGWFFPQFAGCGLLFECRGDFLFDKVLVEVKSGFRAFRTVDFRQVLTYAALNHAKPLHEIHGIALYNARLDRYLSFSVDDLCLQLAGERPVDIFERILDFVSSSMISGV